MACFSFLTPAIGTQHTTTTTVCVTIDVPFYFLFVLSYKHPVGLYNLNLRYHTFKKQVLSIRTAYKWLVLLLLKRKRKTFLCCSLAPKEPIGRYSCESVFRKGETATTICRQTVRVGIFLIMHFCLIVVCSIKVKENAFQNRQQHWPCTDGAKAQEVYF